MAVAKRGFAGSDRFTYTVDDGQGNSASATVDITEEEEREKRRVEAEEA
jgi:hypothetical protein